MRELLMTDAEIHALIAPAIRARLVAAGFRTGSSSDADLGEGNGAFFFPINLNLSGRVVVERGEDGVWTFTQEDDAVLADRTAESLRLHAGAIERRERASNRETNHDDHSCRGRRRTDL